MKVYIGPHTKWVGPYQIAEKVLFWKDKNEDDSIVYKFGDWLAERKDGSPTALSKFCAWLDKKKKRKVSVRIDRGDTWSVDHTLAIVIVPLLKQLKEDKHGAPLVDDRDVPKELRSTSAPALTEEEKNNGTTDNNYFKRWDWVLDEMIWTFEQYLLEDWKEQYTSGKVDLKLEKKDDDKYSSLVEGPDHTCQIDTKAIDAHQKRMDLGRRLFAKYYENLWS